MDFEYLPQGMNFARAAIALALADDNDASGALRIATDRWGRNSRAAAVIKGQMLTKGAVAGGGTGSGEWGAELAADARQTADEFLQYVRPQTILGKLLQWLRRAPARTPFVAQSGGAVAYWTSEGKATPVSPLAFAQTSMVPLKIACLTVLSNDLLRDSSPEAEQLILADLARAVAELSDMTFIDSTNAGIAGSMPAAITYGAIELASTGALADDLEAAIGAFSGSLTSASWIMHPRLGASIGLRSGGRGVAADLGARGGTLAGLPAITSESCAIDSDGSGSITLIDAGGVCLVDEGATAARSQHATVEMDTTPTGDTTTPTAASQRLVNLFQEDSTGLILTRRVNWQAARQSSVVVITGAGFFTAS